MKNTNKRGEITTVLTIAALLILGGTTLISSVFLKDKKTTKTKAAESCETMANNKSGKTPAGAKSGKGKGANNSKESCNIACCEYDGQCSTGQVCDIPNDYCDSGFSCNIDKAGRTRKRCDLGKCVLGPCEGSDCSPQCETDKQCETVKPGTGGGTSQTGPGEIKKESCFYLTVDVEVKDEQQGKRKGFYTYVKVHSPEGGSRGDIQLHGNGQPLAGWNRFDGNPFVYSPQWTQPDHSQEVGVFGWDTGQKNLSSTFSYTVGVQGCPSKSITCTVGVDEKGEPAPIQGTNCFAKNFSNAAVKPPAVAAPPAAAPPAVPPAAPPAAAPRVAAQPNYIDECVNHPDKEKRASGYFKIGEDYYACDNFDKILSKVDKIFVEKFLSHTSVSTPVPEKPTPTINVRTEPAKTAGDIGGDCFRRNNGDSVEFYCNQGAKCNLDKRICEDDSSINLLYITNKSLQKNFILSVMMLPNNKIIYFNQQELLRMQTLTIDFTQDCKLSKEIQGKLAYRSSVDDTRKVKDFTKNCEKIDEIALE